MHALESRIPYLLHMVPLPPGVVLPFLVTLVLGLLAWYVHRAMLREQTLLGTGAEMVVGELEGLFAGILGPADAAQMTPFLGTLFIFVMVENLLGLLPGLKSPTATFSNCLAMALVVIISVQVIGLRRHGLGYLKHFCGEPIWLAPLFLPIHIIGEIARPMSLTLRLFGNIMGEDVVILVLVGFLCPLFLPLPMMVLAIFTSLIQALVFTMLSCIYIAGALQAGHHEGESPDEGASHG